MVRLLAILVLCVSLSGCLGKSAGKSSAVASASAAGAPVATPIQSGALPAPDRTDLFEQNRPYLIGPFDKLNIDVFGIEELSRKEIQADAGGRISFPLAGIIDASGKSPGELEKIIEERLRGRFVRDPQVTVNLKESVSQVITVDGEVKEPGLYPVIGRMTLLRAVATAKGTNDQAKLDDVVIFRTVKGQRMYGLYNLKAIRKGTYEDPEVFANDVVVVGDSQSRRLFKDGLQLLPALLTPLIYLFTTLNNNNTI